MCRYYALSYTWDNPHAMGTRFNFHERHAAEYDSDNLFPISCNGKLLLVRQNLYDALQTLPEFPHLFVKKGGGSGKSMKDDLQIAAARKDLTALRSVCHKGQNTELLTCDRISLQLGSDVTSKDSDGRTALSIAAGDGSLEVVCSTSTVRHFRCFCY